MPTHLRCLNRCVSSKSVSERMVARQSRQSVRRWGPTKSASVRIHPQSRPRAVAGSLKDSAKRAKYRVWEVREIMSAAGGSRQSGKILDTFGQGSRNSGGSGQIGHSSQASGHAMKSRRYKDNARVSAFSPRRSRAPVYVGSLILSQLDGSPYVPRFHFGTMPSSRSCSQTSAKQRAAGAVQVIDVEHARRVAGHHAP